MENRFGFTGVNFVESYGPNSLINGQYPVDNIWLTPLSFDMANCKCLVVAIIISIFWNPVIWSSINIESG